ncbi:MAG: thrombospondin type 3 repeat-containing protein [Patescibacteria group bacterium]
MGRILENWRITAATVFSAVLIVSTYVFVHGLAAPARVEASEETELLKAIATRDSDGDGLADWEEGLYGTDPHMIDTFKLGMTDGEAVLKGLVVAKALADASFTSSTSPASVGVDGLPPAPAEGTLTAAFAQSFFTLYLAAKQENGGAELTEGQMSAVANKAVSTLAATTAIAPDFKTAAEVKVVGSGREALLAYAVSAEAVMTKNTNSAGGTPLVHLRRVVQGGDASGIDALVSISKMYHDSAVGVAALPVPAEAAAADLGLMNALMRMSQISADFARVNDDPLAAILALQQYVDAAQALRNAFIAVGQIYASAGITLPSGAPGATFVNLIADVAKSQQAVSQP